MSPDRAAAAASLARLRAEVRADRDGLALRVGDGREAKRRLDAAPPDAGALALGAVALHGYYTGLETIFERIARELDGAVPPGERWHRDLLVQMSAEIPGVRPPVIARADVDELAALLAFRHFFRHAYAATLDPNRICVELARLLAIAQVMTVALDALDAFLARSLDEIARGGDPA